MVITLCGSFKYLDLMKELEFKLVMNGYTVLIPVWPSEYKDEFIRKLGINKVKEELRRNHKRKIELSDVVLIVNEDNYIGTDTGLERDYSMEIGKEVMYWYDMFDDNDLLSTIRKFEEGRERD